MSEYWKSQPRKFCDVCCCWIADNKASIAFHEGGKRHKEAMAKKIADIRAKSSANDRRAKKEEAWIEEMERAAMQVYRDKDLLGGADITARMFNEKKSERDAQKAAIEAAIAEAQEQQSAGSSSRDIGPQVPGAKVVAGLRPVEAPKSGTKWHKGFADTEAKQWFEAVTDEGHTYFWHVESHESRWEPPPEGYLSIQEQEEINRRHEEKEAKKLEQIYESQTIHGSHKDEGQAELEAVAAAAKSYGPQQRHQPYGQWQTVETTTTTTTSTRPNKIPSSSYKKQEEAPSEAPQQFRERSTPSMASSSTSGGFVFKKRKLNGEHKKQFRRRTDD